MSASHMTAHERVEFRGFCQNATDKQIVNIESDEKGRAEREEAKNDGSSYYAMCYELARSEREKRGLEPA